MKRARMWILVALLVAHSMAASLNTLPGEDLRTAEWEGPLFEAGGRSSGCGSNASQVNVSVWTTPSSPDHNDDVNATFYIQCPIANDAHTMEYWLNDSSGYEYQSSDWSWTATNSWSSNNVIFSNLSADTYTLEYHLTNYTGAVNLTGSMSFTVQSPTCTVSPYAGQSMFDIGENFTGQIDSYCSFTTEALNLTWSIVNDDTNSTVDSGSFSWNIFTSSEYHTVNSTALSTQSEGNFSFLATLSWYNTSSYMWEELDNGSDWFMVYNFSNSGGSNCGSEPSDASVWAYSDTYVYDLGEDFGGVIYSYCALLNETLMLDWSIKNTDTNTTVDTGSFNWTAMQTYDSHNVTSTALANESIGNYTFTVDWTWYNTTSNMWEDLDSDHDDFSIQNLSSSSGNACSVYAWSNHSVYDLGESFTGEIDTYCGMTNESMSLAWLIMNDDTNATVDFGFFNWTSMTYGEFHSVNSSSLATQGEGNYTFAATLSWYNNSSMMWEVLDSDTDGFIVYNFSSGGGNTSGPTCAVYAYSYYYAYAVGDNFYGEIDTYCSLTNATLWTGWTVVNLDSNSTVDSGSQSWNNTQWHTTQWLNSTSLVNVSAGNYSFEVELKWWNTSSSGWETLDNDSDTFVVYASNGGGSGGSNNCSVYAWSDHSVYDIGESFTGEINTYCGSTNETMSLAWLILNDDTNATVGFGYFNWTSMTTSEIHTVNSSSLATQGEGNYSFAVTLSWYNTSSMMWEVLDSDSDSFMVDNSTSSTMPVCSLYAWSSQTTYNVGDNFSGEFYSSCNFVGEYVNLTYWITDDATGSYVDWGIFSWTNTVYNETHTINSSNLATEGVGNYTFGGTIALWDNTTGWNVLDMDNTSFVVVSSSTPSWNLSDGELDIDTYGENFTSGTALYAQYEATNLIIGQTYRVEWEILDVNNTVVVENQTDWSATSDSYIFSVYESGLADGYYCFYGDLYATDTVNNTTVTVSWIAGDDTCVTVGEDDDNGTNQTGCGYDTEDFYITGWLNTWDLIEGDTANISVYTNCNLLNETMFVSYGVTDSGENTIAEGQWSWTAMSIMEEHFIEAMNLSAGVYNVTLVASYYNETTVLDSYFFQFNVSEVATNNTGCGYEEYLFSIYGMMNTVSPMEGDDVNLSVISDCALYDAEMRIDYTVHKNSPWMGILAGNWSWTAFTTYDHHYIELSGLTSGSYNVSLEASADGMTLDTYVFQFTVAEPTGCGYTAEDAMVTGWNNTGYVTAGGTLNVTAYTECAVLGQWMYLHYNVYDPANNLVDSGNWSWIANMLDEEHHLELTNAMAGTYNFSFSLATAGTYNYVDHEDVLVYVDEAPDTGTEDNNTSTTNALPECLVYAYVSTALAPDADPTSIAGMTALELPLSGSETVPLVPGTYVIAVVCTDADSDVLSMSLTSDGQTFGGTNYDGQFFVQAFFQVSNTQDFTHEVTVEWDDGVDSGVLELTFTTDLQSVIDDLEEEEAGGLPGFGAVSSMVAIAIGVAVSGRRKDE